MKYNNHDERNDKAGNVTTSPVEPKGILIVIRNLERQNCTWNVCSYQNQGTTHRNNNRAARNYTDTSQSQTNFSDHDIRVMQVINRRENRNENRSENRNEYWSENQNENRSKNRRPNYAESEAHREETLNEMCMRKKISTTDYPCPAETPDGMSPTTGPNTTCWTAFRYRNVDRTIDSTIATTNNLELRGT